MVRRAYIQCVVFLLLAAILLPACTGGSGREGGVGGIESIKDATIRIVAQGSFIDPQVGMVVNAAGSGSGFIIDPSGIAVTNNHVVTGAALLKVYIGGEDKAYNAKVIGVSECSDLAVIDIEGEGFPYLEWFEGEIKVGMDVFAAGFPLGDPEFTLTKGIISKERTAGETPWSSVDHVLEHDAVINPGSSGGPLVTEDGKVVGVNYLKSAATQFVAAQYFAIASPQAQPLLETLRSGENVDSVGINGEAVNNGEGLSGIWVSSVKSGSPADTAGIQGGDILLTMEGLVLATDYTMSHYCDILRTHQSDDVLSLSVLRFSSQEILEGQLNGRSLVASYSFGTELGPLVNVREAEEEPAYQAFSSVTDFTGLLRVEIPSEWDDIDPGEWAELIETVYAALAASPDIIGFQNTRLQPGINFVLYNRARVGSVESELSRDAQFYQDCTYVDQYEFQTSRFSGKYNLYGDCGGPGGALNISLYAEPRESPNDYLLWLQVQVLSDADLFALDHILQTIEVSNSLPGGE